MIESFCSSEPPQQLQTLPPAPWTVQDKVNSFAILDGHLLWRLQASPDQHWSQASFPQDKKVVAINADWNDLMVEDQEGLIHYAKSAKGNDSLMLEPKWQKGIFDLPLIGTLFNHCVYKHPLPKEVKEGLWSCSFNESGNFYQDKAGQKHFLGEDRGEIGPTTALYIPDPVTRKIRLYDPYIFKGPEDKEKIFIPYPETTHSTFELITIKACRSCLFLIGYDVSSRDEGGVIKQLALYTILADANAMGINPFIRYTYSLEKTDPQKFVLPISKYKRIELPQGSVTSTIGISRTSEKGNDAYFLTIEGKQESQCGYFMKKLEDKVWDFVTVESHRINPTSILSPSESNPNQEFSSTVANYEGKLLNEGEFPATLTDFGENSMSSKITITFSSQFIPILKNNLSIKF